MSSSKKTTKSNRTVTATKAAAARETTKKSTATGTAVKSGGAKASAPTKTSPDSEKAPTTSTATKSVTKTVAATVAKKTGVSAKSPTTKAPAAAAAPAKTGQVKAQAGKPNQDSRATTAPVKAAAAVVGTAAKAAVTKAGKAKPAVGTTSPAVSAPTGTKAGKTQSASAVGAGPITTSAKTENSNKLASKIVASVGKAAVVPGPANPGKASVGSGPVAETEKVAAPVPAAKVPSQSAPAREPEKTPAPASAAARPKAAAPKNGFRLNEFIVYPAHGVGQIIGVETQEVAGFSLELYVVSFIKDKMILKVPTSKVATVGMRKLAETNIVEKALSTLSGRARVKRTMWSRRAQEYEAKINSGDLVTIAEVVRDLYRSDTQPEQSYSERQLYEAALDRMAREISAVRRLIDAEALKLIESFLQKGPKRGARADSEVEGEIDAEETDVERAA
jgi:CarD family transcriptional regulator